MKPKVNVGTWFKSHTFSADAQIKAIRKDVNQVDILFRDSEGIQWMVENSNLQALRDSFANGTHYIPEQDKTNISII